MATKGALRGVHAFDQPGLFAPETIVLDTSFAVQVLLPGQTHHRAARAFLRALIEQGTPLVFSRLLDAELAEAAFRVGLRERHPKRWQAARHDGRVRRSAGMVMQQVLSAWEEVLEASDWVRIELEHVLADVPDLMIRYGLASYDAVHVSTARYVGVKDFATLDTGFAKVRARDLVLHVDRSRLRRCREIRGRI